MSFKKVFTVLFLGHLFLGLIFFIPMMILVFLGYVPITINEKPYYGWIGILLPLVYLPVFSAMSSVFYAGIFSTGLWVYKSILKKSAVPVLYDVSAAHHEGK